MLSLVAGSFELNRAELTDGYCEKACQSVPEGAARRSSNRLGLGLKLEPIKKKTIHR